MAASVSSYEKQRQKNIEENRKVLQSLGLLNGGLLQQGGNVKTSGRSSGGKYRKQGVKRKRSGCYHEKPAQSTPSFEGYRARRWSRRLEGKEPAQHGSLDFDFLDEDDERPIIKRTPRISENVFGSIPGIPAGTTWASRLDCSRDGVHRPTVAGIHGNETEGCFSLALSGGYEDDLDFGLAFTYTGAGGRDLKGTKANPKNLRTAPQSMDQTLTRSNLALSRNVESRQPIRVIRGFKLDSPYAPEEGYRYDGLYTVERFWEATGLSGYMVYKFALKRCGEQAPPPWKLNVADLMNDDHEKEELPEDEPAGLELEAERAKMEESGAEKTEEHAMPAQDQKVDANSESGDCENGKFPEMELAGMKPEEKRGKTEESGAKNMEEPAKLQSAVDTENGEQQIRENGVLPSQENGVLPGQELAVEKQEAGQSKAADIKEQKGLSQPPREL